MPEPEVLFVVLRLMPWSSLTLVASDGSGLPGVIEAEASGPVGFVPVCATREAADEWSEDGRYPVRMVRATQAGTQEEAISDRR